MNWGNHYFKLERVLTRGDYGLDALSLARPRPLARAVPCISAFRRFSASGPGKIKIVLSLWCNERAMV